MVHLPECLGRLKEQVVMLVLRGVPRDPGSALSPTCNASGSWRSVLEACRSTISTLHCRLWVLGVTHRIPPPKAAVNQWPHPGGSSNRNGSSPNSGAGSTTNNVSASSTLWGIPSSAFNSWLSASLVACSYFSAQSSPFPAAFLVVILHLHFCVFCR